MRFLFYSKDDHYIGDVRVNNNEAPSPEMNVTPLQIKRSRNEWKRNGDQLEEIKFKFIGLGPCNERIYKES